MKYYEIIETKKKFSDKDIACEYSLDNVNTFGFETRLDFKTPISKNIFIKLYLTKSGNRILKRFGYGGEVIVLLKEELEKIYTTEDSGYILSDDFEQYVYFCDIDSELDEKIGKIGTEIIKKTYFVSPLYHRSIRFVDNKMIIRSEYFCWINLLNNEEIKLENCDKLDKTDIQKTIYDFLAFNKKCLSFKDLSDSIKELLLVIEKKYGTINNIYDTPKKYIMSDEGVSKSLIIETAKKLITINIGSDN